MGKIRLINYDENINGNEKGQVIIVNATGDGLCTTNLKNSLYVRSSRINGDIGSGLYFLPTEESTYDNYPNSITEIEQVEDQTFAITSKKYIILAEEIVDNLDVEELKAFKRTIDLTNMACYTTDPLQVTLNKVPGGNYGFVLTNDKMKKLLEISPKFNDYIKVIDQSYDFDKKEAKFRESSLVEKKADDFVSVEELFYECDFGETLPDFVYDCTPIELSPKYIDPNTGETVYKKSIKIVQGHHNEEYRHTLARLGAKFYYDVTNLPQDKLDVLLETGQVHKFASIENGKSGRPYLYKEVPLVKKETHELGK